MTIDAIKTPAVRAHDDLWEIIKNAITEIPERSVLAVTSKIVSLCEGNVVPSESITRDELVKTEADYYIPSSYNPYGFCISVKNNTLIASAGIDVSNGEGEFILWPKDPQASANRIREFLQKEYGVQEVGVVITDSHVLPLRWGTHGTSIAHTGFVALNDYRGKPDIFGNTLKVSQANVAEGLASSAVLVMGEGSEQTPLVLMSNLPFVQFQPRNPTDQELKDLAISLEEDVFSPLLKNAPWTTGK